mgnify:CR=1 FL=1
MLTIKSVPPVDAPDLNTNAKPIPIKIPPYMLSKKKSYIPMFILAKRSIVYE